MNIPLALRFVSNRVPNHRNRVHQIDGLNGTKDRDQPTNGIEDTYDNQSLTLKDSIKRSKSPQRPPVSLHRSSVRIVFENHQKCLIWIDQFWRFQPIWYHCLTATFGFSKTRQNWHINQLLSTQNVNLARFARNVECDFGGDLQTPCDVLKNEAWWEKSQMCLCIKCLLSILRGPILYWGWLMDPLWPSFNCWHLD